MLSDDRWSFAAGPHGYRVRVRERTRGGNVYLYSYDEALGGNRKTSLGYPVRDCDGELIEDAVEAAKAAVGEASNALIAGANPHEREEEATTLGDLFDAFRREEVQGEMSERHRKGVLRELELLERFLGRGLEVENIGLREWNAVKRARASGEVDARGRRVPRKEDHREVDPRTVAKTLKVLRQACRFGERYRTRGEPLVDRDPTKGLELPREQDPNRPVCSDALLRKLLEAAPRVLMGHGKDRERSHLLELLVVAADTGARIGEVVRLRWSDWDPEEATHGTLRWRGKHQKNGRTRVTPVTARVRKTLETHRRRHPGVAEAHVFPAPESKGHVRVDVALRWWREAEAEAGVEHRKGMGFHALRRRWANRMKDRSPVDAAALGGWADVATMQQVYQRADLSGMERALLGDNDGREAAGGGGRT